MDFWKSVFGYYLVTYYVNQMKLYGLKCMTLVYDKYNNSFFFLLTGFHIYSVVHFWLYYFV